MEEQISGAAAPMQLALVLRGSGSRMPHPARDGLVSPP